MSQQAEGPLSGRSDAKRLQHDNDDRIIEKRDDKSSKATSTTRIAEEKKTKFLKH